jgi:hypothetical protein
MKRPHLWVLSTVLAALALLSARPALACKCALPSVEEGRADASALFEGRVLSIEEKSREGAMPVNHVKLAVVRSWKGLDREEQVEVTTNTQSAACGYTFAKDTSYLVYARESDGQLDVSLCSRTRPLADAAEDLAILGAGATPVRVTKAIDTDAGGVAKDAAQPGSAQQRPPSEVPPAKKRGCSLAGEHGANADGAGALFAGLGLLALIVRRRRLAHSAG